MTRPKKTPLFSTDPMWAVVYTDRNDKSILLCWVSDSEKVMILSTRHAAQNYIAWRAEKAGIGEEHYRAVEYYPTGGDYAVDTVPGQNSPF